MDDVLEEKKRENEENEETRKKGKSYVCVYGVEQALKVVEELRVKAKKELDGFEKYGESVAPLYCFVDYAVNRGFKVDVAS